MLDPQTGAMLRYLQRGGAYGYYWTLAGKASTWWPIDAPPDVPARNNVYFGVHPSSVIPPTNARGDAKPPAEVRAQNATIAALNCLYAEFDAKDHGGSKPATLAAVQRVDPPASIIVDSGGGYHAYWLLDEPYILDNDATRHAAAALQARWVTYTGSDPAAKDLARVLRVPGTRNTKYDAPLAVEFVRCDLAAAYRIDELAALAPPPDRPVPLAALPTMPLPEPSAAPSGDWRDQRRNGVDAAMRRWVAGRLDYARGEVAAAGDGGRHKRRLEMGRLLGGVIAAASTYLSESEALDLLYSANPPERNVKQEEAAIRDGIRYGRSTPVPLPDVPTDTPIIVDKTGAPRCPSCAAKVRRSKYDYPGDVTPGWYCPDCKGPMHWPDSAYTPPAPVQAPAPAAPVVIPVSGASSDLVSIDITDERLGDATGDIWRAMAGSAYAPALYRYGSEVAHLTTVLTPIDLDRWRGMVNRVAQFIVIRRGKFGESTKVVLPPLAMIRDSLLFVPDDVPMIERVSNLPIFTTAGAILHNGYDAAMKSLILDAPDLTPMSLEAARSLILDDLFVDFPFASSADLANAVAYLLTPFVRELCGATPLYLIDAAQRGTGKTLLNDLIHTIWTAKPAPLSDLPLNAEEQRKQLTTALMSAPVSLVFDDISYLSGHAIQRAVTGQTWRDRILGTNKEVEIPIRCVWVATGNNVSLGGDMVRRTILIRLESQDEAPSQRTGFKRNESAQRSWVRDNRALLVSACVTLVQHGLAHGKSTDVTLGGFDQFVRVMSKVLNGCDIAGFCGNLPSVYNREDSRQSGWKQIVKEWYDRHDTKPVKAGDVAALIEACADSEIIIDGDSPRARAVTTGKLLRSKLGSIYAYADVRLRIDQTKTSKGDAAYRLAVVDAPVAKPEITIASCTFEDGTEGWAVVEGDTPVEYFWTEDEANDAALRRIVAQQGA